MAVANRAYIEKLIYDTFDALDPSGTNTTKYRVMFGDMNDAQFEKFMKDFLKNDGENFALDIVDFEHDVHMEYCEKAAKVLGIPLMEYVYMPHLTMDKKHVVVSKEKCLVGYINVKRTQQLLHKKNKNLKPLLKDITIIFAIKQKFYQILTKQYSLKLDIYQNQA